ncbi:hypothetical protein [Curtobacterium sp. BRD11]|uniref:hypothetical protein n=1 Tax=Curtobacterium sp. BRD11 TaxID=2962581 RepID=UPI002882C841|nr:hypothetical protein [Curtobacterium sp. BRD11]MDT0212056.1 hypothetical protein [Curtobacterium sp. BRD11]
MHTDDGHQYARLPEDLLATLLQRAPAAAQEVEALLLPALQQRDQLRTAAEQSGLILTAQPAKSDTVCAVDGGFAVERTVAVDMVMAVAVGVEGFSGPGQPGREWDHNQYQSFERVLVHNVDNERLARAAMIVHELGVLADSPHLIRVYDGSHLTPIIQLNSGFSSADATVSGTSGDLAVDYDLVGSLESFVANPAIVAMPKYDSSRVIADALSKQIGLSIPGDDKYVTSMILQPGEYTRPTKVEADPWRQLHLFARQGSELHNRNIVRALDDIIQPLRDRRMYFLYWKPDEAAPTYRLEVKPEIAESSEHLHRLFASLQLQITGPFVREPYPQYLADVIAKSVGLGLSALRAAAHLHLARHHEELAPMLVQSYRTEGV